MEVIRTLKALADPSRLRVLAAVAEEELTVGEVQEVVASVQSSVSRNLAILREAGFVQGRKEGTNVYFSVRRDMPEAAREILKSLRARLAELPEVKGDKARLESCRRRRAQRSRDYFESVAGDWERIRKSYFDDRVTSLAIEKLLGVDVPYRAQLIRVLYSEIGRILSHLLNVTTQAKEVNTPRNARSSISVSNFSVGRRGTINRTESAGSSRPISIASFPSAPSRLKIGPPRAACWEAAKSVSASARAATPIPMTPTSAAETQRGVGTAGVRTMRLTSALTWRACW